NRVVERWTSTSTGHAAETKPPAQGFDQVAYDELKAMFEPETLIEYLDAFTAMMDEIPGEESDRQALGQRAHRMISVAGMLGFVRLSRLSAELESACNLDGDLTESLKTLDAAKVDASRRLEELRSAA